MIFVIQALTCEQTAGSTRFNRIRVSRLTSYGHCKESLGTKLNLPGKQHH